MGKMALGRIQKFLLDYHIPATIRVKVLESIVQATCIYGAEVWGGDIKDCSEVQTILNEGMRYITQGKRMNATSISVMQFELDLCPIYPVIVKKRMRVGWKGRQKSLMPVRTSQIQEMTIKRIQKNQIQETIRVTLEISERIRVIPRQVAAPIRRKNPM